VFAAQLAATRSLEHGARGGPSPGLIVWPEDVIALVGVSSLPRIGPSPRSGELATAGALARRLDATLVAGVTVTVSDRAFRNEIVVWAPTGRIVAIYEMVHRVPFGEYVPYRSLIAHLADLSAVPLDAVPGTGTGLVRTPVGPLGILVSFEVFFADRSRASVRAGAEALVVPTNTSSYATDQVPGQEVAADRVQAVESGRDLVQAAPTGYSTLVRANGDVVERSSLGPPHVLRGTISLRVGTTVYIRFGDLPTLVVSGLALLFGLALGRREAAVSRSSRSGCTRKGSPRRRTSRGWSDRPPAPAEDRIRTGAGPPPPVA
jgi:apolipoprotein N-acyltransferase